MKVNLLAEEKAVANPANAGTSPVKFFISPLVVVLVFAGSFAMGRVSLSDTASAAFAPLSELPIFSQMRHLVGSPDRKLIGEAEDRVNVLLIGMGGEGHDGPNLTDTIIVASLRPSDNSVALLSVPRDLLVPVDGQGWRKINAVNAFGELRETGRGGELLRTTMENLLGIDIPYYVRIDFAGFKQIIDSVDGVDVYVERAFTDRTYPTYDHGLQAVTFEEGWQHMNGESALRFARSRHGNNGEGSDFARSKRQQKVISALKEKLLSFKTFRNPVTVTNTLSALQANVTTNLHLGEILRMARMAQDVGKVNISHKVLDNRVDGVLADSVVGGAYVLLPRNNDWTLIRGIAENIFEIAEAPPTDQAVPPPPVPADEKATVEIQNGNGTSGVARVMSEKLRKLGFEVIKIGNADNFDYGSSIVFDLTDGDKKASLDRLSSAFDDAVVRGARDASKHSPTGDADFLIILGKE